MVEAATATEAVATVVLKEAAVRRNGRWRW